MRRVRHLDRGRSVPHGAVEQLVETPVRCLATATVRRGLASATSAWRKLLHNALTCGDARARAPRERILDWYHLARSRYLTRRQFGGYRKNAQRIPVLRAVEGARGHVDA
jgi:hypothetical protein